MNRQEKWDLRFLKLAKEVASWSKDPSTKVGCVITRNVNEIVSQGYNGFPEDYDDSEELYLDRDYKLVHIKHAEENAILRSRGYLAGCTVYTFPFLSCQTCAEKLCEKGIYRIVTLSGFPKRWDENFTKAEIMYINRGVNVDYYEPKYFLEYI